MMGENDCCALCISLQTKQKVFQLNNFKYPIQSFEYSPFMDYIFTGHSNGLIIAWKGPTLYEQIDKLGNYEDDNYEELSEHKIPFRQKLLSSISKETNSIRYNLHRKNSAQDYNKKLFQKKIKQLIKLARKKI